MNDGRDPPLRAFFDSTFKGGANPNDWMNIIHAPTSGFGLRSASGPARRPSADQRAFYRENGFLLARGLVPLSLIDQLRHRLRGLNYRVEEVDTDNIEEKIAAREEAEVTARVLKDVLSQFIRVPTLLDWVEDFCGKDVLSLGAMFVRIPPAEGHFGARLHQNGYFIPVEADEGRVVSVWSPLEVATSGGGVAEALTVLPGTHRGPLLQHDLSAHEQGALISNPPKGVNSVSLAVEPGDAIFLHPRLLHGSQPNRNGRERTELVAHYASAKAPFQERPHVNQDYWKQNVQLVRGVSSNL
ncbi:phytanoyl-CoA dioxygenase, peroxisomal-like [Ornithodoros turicata]|uniref:phytanoyl-CoA dioxygenase, peroxisomal-like n=1 Tax=Ornithodoros turicata TaxID=34597 RepID=UPI00313872CF